MSISLCSVVGGNTGGVLCDTKRAVPVKIVAGGKEFTSTEYADADTFQAALLAACKLEAGNSSKLFPFPEIGEVEILTEQDTEGNLALGHKKRLRKGKPGYRYSVEMSHNQFQRLLAFDGETVPVFTLDDENNYWGYRASAAVNTPNTNVFKGEQAYITISGNGFKNGTDASSGVATITVSYLSVDDFERRGTYINLPNLSATDLVGLKEVLLSQPSAAVSNAYKIKMTLALNKLAGDLNIYDDFGSAIAALTFTAFTGADYSTSLAITTVAVDATNKCLTVTFDSTAHTALPSGTKIKLVPPTPTVLDAADVPGIELPFIILTKA